jgi:hypothetical protein
MWQPLSKILNFIGRVRIPVGPPNVTVMVGRANAPDALSSIDWKRFASAEALYDVWAPPKGSRWTPYHCVPLFAALQTLPRNQFGPTDEETVKTIEMGPLLTPAVDLKPLGASWASERAWVILDLPGPQSVALAVRFVAAGFQPVCTFDHWPHPMGLVKAHVVLAQLLRHASSIEKLRPYLQPDAAPLWICDRNRLGTQPGRPKQFDNRYFLDDSILPSAKTLKEADIRHIICVMPTPAHRPCDDLRAYFRDLKKEGFQIDAAALSDPALTLFELPPATFQVDFTQHGYQRSSAGGFGRLIPEPSSSSG